MISSRNNQSTWVSHSSISDFLKCPRSYYLRNVLKSKATNRKMTIVSPPLALGQAVHEALESLSLLPKDERFKTPLTDKFEDAWGKVTGKKGGFKNAAEEEEYKERGRKMILRVLESPGILLNKAVRIKPRSEKDRLSNFDLPYYKISEDDNITLCGKIDWLEYLEEENAVHIVDFKTGKNEEDQASLQLPIYYLLAKNCQSFNVSRASYWYVDRENKPRQVSLPNEIEAKESVLEIAKRIKLARQLQLFKCPRDGCFSCLPYEAVLRGNGECVGVSETNQDIYILI
ncbi:MAG: PD-(D/E)XK nuclease family protein [Candidatus Blackburnbacteria bacterium]|nr:PD-(D/E)XK nuclease family protein [Candidatus Blackburnbacteria bacterium]